MTGAEVLEIMREKPFRPIRIHVTDGTTYDVHHPDQVFVTQRQLLIGIASDPNSFTPYEHVAKVDTYHVTQITTLVAEVRLK